LTVTRTGDAQVNRFALYGNNATPAMVGVEFAWRHDLGAGAATGLFIANTHNVSGSYLQFAILGGTSVAAMKVGIGTSNPAYMLDVQGTLGCGALTATTIKCTPGAFVASDKYLVVDPSGNVHVSALGPAS
jgi:hypothetical protein